MLVSCIDTRQPATERSAATNDAFPTDWQIQKRHGCSSGNYRVVVDFSWKTNLFRNGNKSPTLKERTCPEQPSYWVTQKAPVVRIETQKIAIDGFQW